MDKQTIDKDLLIKTIAQRADFAQKDVRVILDELIKVFEESALSGTEISVRGFGRLKFQQLKERTITKGKYAGRVLPPVKRITFKLAEGIRFPLPPED
jgi:nucleoid DNA-binding protein